MTGRNETWERRIGTETRSGPVTSSSGTELRVPGLTILWHPDSRRVGERVALPELVSDREVLLSRLEPLFSQRDEARRRPLAEAHVSRRPIRLRSLTGGEIGLDCGESKTELMAGGEKVAKECCFSQPEMEDGVVLLLSQRVALLLHLISPASPGQVPRFDMVGESPKWLAVRQEIERVAGLDLAVLIRGETGTGKELVARALHDQSPRRDRPYLAINMGAVPATLAAAELFGAAKGAFTGADKPRSGYFRRAQDGSLFLDEVGEIPAAVQVLLLRTLETGEIQPVGSDEPRRVNVRVIAATDADLDASSEAGGFKAPLLHRLRGYEIRLPPLRQRRDDVGRLVLHFLRHELESVKASHLLEDPGPDETPWLAAALVARLAAHSWPGNVRQLRNLVRQLVVRCHGSPEANLDAATVQLLDAGLAPGADQGPAASPQSPPASGTRAPAREYRHPMEVGEEELLEALKENRWRLQLAAAQLGISRTSLYKLIESSPHVRKPRDLTAEEIEAARENCGGDLEAMVDLLQVSRKGLHRRMTELGLHRRAAGS